MVCHGPTDLRLPVGDLLRMLGVNLAPELREQLDERGDLCFGETGFDNAGPEIRREVRMMGISATMEIASPLRGNVARQADRFVLQFEPGGSISVGRFVFDLELEALAVDPDCVTASFRRGPEVRIHLVEEVGVGAPA